MLLVDAGVLGEPQVEADIAREEVARAARRRSRASSRAPATAAPR